MKIHYVISDLTLVVGVKTGQIRAHIALVSYPIFFLGFGTGYGQAGYEYESGLFRIRTWAGYMMESGQKQIKIGQYNTHI